MEFIKSEKLKYEYSRFNEETNENESIEALKGLDITIDSGEFVAVLGHNGSGKSTFAKLINGLYSPKDGVLIVNGYDTKVQENIWNIRQNVGMVFQNPDNQIIATVVEEDVAFGPENLGMEPKTIAENVDKALHAVSMEEFRYSAPNYLSGGQKQRVAIAGILAMTPKCIIFDEPTAALDPLNAAMLEEVLQKMGDEGRTMLISTHDVDFAYRWAERVIVFCHGKIIADDTPLAVFKQEDILKQANLKHPMMFDVYDILKEKGIVPDGDVYPKNIAEFQAMVKGL